jgi:hypothetical protein
MTRLALFVIAAMALAVWVVGDAMVVVVVVVVDGVVGGVVDSTALPGADGDRGRGVGVEDGDEGAGDRSDPDQRVRSIELFPWWWVNELKWKVACNRVLFRYRES